LPTENLEEEKSLEEEVHHFLVSTTLKTRKRDWKTMRHSPSAFGLLRVQLDLELQ